MPFVLNYKFTPYTQDQHLELARYPQFASLFKYLEENRFQLRSGPTGFFFDLDYQDSLFSVVAYRYTTSDNPISFLQLPCMYSTKERRSKCFI